MSLSSAKGPMARHRKPPRLARKPRGVSLFDTQFARLPLRITTPTFLMGIGTMSCIAVGAAIRYLQEAVGRLPNVVGHLLIDAEADTGRSNAHFVALKSYGAGTDSTKGRDIIEAARPRIYKALLAHVLPLLAGDPAYPTPQSARQATSFHVVAGPGGTGGGGLHPMVSLLHEVTRKLSIQKAYVHVHLIGPDMPMRDIDRVTSPAQREVVDATFGRNVERLLADLAVDEDLVERSTDGRSFVIRSHDRVRTISLIDQTNGEVDCLITGQLASLLGWTLYQRCFTAVGMHHEARIEDEIGLGIPYGF